MGSSIHFVFIPVYLLLACAILFATMEFRTKYRQFYHKRRCTTVRIPSRKIQLKSVQWDDGWLIPSLPHDIDQWCRDHLSGPHGVVPIHPENLKNGIDALEFWFRLPADAVAFKMAWT